MLPHSELTSHPLYDSIQGADFDIQLDKVIQNDTYLNIKSENIIETLNNIQIEQSGIKSVNNTMSLDIDDNNRRVDTLTAKNNELKEIVLSYRNDITLNSDRINQLEFQTIGEIRSRSIKNETDIKDLDIRITEIKSIVDNVYTKSQTDQKYLFRSGGLMYGDISFFEENIGIRWARNTDYAKINFYNTGDSDLNSRLEFQTGDNGTEFFRWVSNNAGVFSEWMVLKGGNLKISGNIVSSSDISLKDNIEVIKNPIDKIKKIRGVTYTRNDFNDVKQTGVIAQEVEKVLPEVVNEDNGIKSVAYGNMVGLLIESIKEQQETIEALTQRIVILESIK